jgi:hypothetical protein
MEDERTMSMLSHILGLFTSFVGPLIIFLVAREDQPIAKAHAKEALNFQITLALATIVSGILTIILIGFLGLIAVGIGNIIFSILAAMAASRNEDYRYPVCIRFVK